MAFTRKLKLLAVCSKNQWRSPTAAKIFRYDPRIEVRSAGTNAEARHVVSVANIEDNYQFMDPELVELLKLEIEELINR